MGQRGERGIWRGANEIYLCRVSLLDNHCDSHTYRFRYCFGAPYVCNELAGNTVTAGAFAHPAFLKEHHFFNLKSELTPSSEIVDLN